jgi:hypothetical protein
MTIPAGLVFKSKPNIPTGAVNAYSSNQLANGFIVNGRLNIVGTVNRPVVFTHADDDAYGCPADMNRDGKATLPPDARQEAMEGTWLVFQDVSSDLSQIQHAVIKYGQVGIAMQNASPTIQSVRFEQLHRAIDIDGVSAPAIDSCIFHNLAWFPMQISLVSYPRSSTGNVISGTTYKVIKVRDETLTQDVVLPKRDFGGKKNVPYLFGQYTIGTGAKLTIEPGVICKFKKFSDSYYPSYYYDYPYNYYYTQAGLSVSKGLTAEGGTSPDSLIVFTALEDDFYGGDSNADSLASELSVTAWDGITFNNVSLDPECQLSHAVVRYARNGITAVSASPTIKSVLFNRNQTGVNIKGASNPSLIQCDFNENTSYAVNNVDKAFVIEATDCWWGSNAGPVVSDAVITPEGDRQLVSSSVQYDPWQTIGIANPLMGDVSLNGLIQAYDASLVLRQVVSLITLNASQQQVADVSGNGEISAYDASLILQYVVGLQASFPVNRIARSYLKAVQSPIVLTVDEGTVSMGDTCSIKVRANNLAGISGIDICLQYDPTRLELMEVKNLMPSMVVESRIDQASGQVIIAMARAVALSEGPQELVALRLRPKTNQWGETTIQVQRFLGNEIDRTAIAESGTLHLADGVTTLPESKSLKQGMDPISPNPVQGDAILIYRLDETSQWVVIELFSLTGQRIARLVDRKEGPGRYEFQWSRKSSSIQAGTYLLRMRTATMTHTQKIQIGQ